MLILNEKELALRGLLSPFPDDKSSETATKEK
jgi:hypothetical protein